MSLMFLRSQCYSNRSSA